MQQAYSRTLMGAFDLNHNLQLNGMKYVYMVKFINGFLLITWSGQCKSVCSTQQNRNIDLYKHHF